MTRVLLQYLLPFLLPTAVFVLWVLLTRSRSTAARSTMARIQEGPWFWLVASGTGLMVAVLVTIAVTEGADPGASYTAPRFEDGRVVPGEFR